MKRLLSLAAALLLAESAAAGSYTAGPMTAAEPWSRPAVAGMTGAGFLMLSNKGGAAETLLGVTSPVAAKVEMHRSSTAGGVSRMGKVERLAIPAGGQVVFAPGGYHLMLVGLKGPLKAGQKFPATLSFASGRKLAIAFTVSEGMGPPLDGHQHH